MRVFLQAIGIIRYKILWLKQKKIISFLSLAYMPISTYLRPNIHQNDLKILGVKPLDITGCNIILDHVVVISCKESKIIE
jgi:hypothetical protein